MLLLASVDYLVILVVFKKCYSVFASFAVKRGFEVEANDDDVDDDQTCSYSFSCKYCQKANYHHKKIHSTNRICNRNFYVIFTLLTYLIYQFFSSDILKPKYGISNNSIFLDAKILQ